MLGFQTRAITPSFKNKQTLVAEDETEVLRCSRQHSKHLTESYPISWNLGSDETHLGLTPIFFFYFGLLEKDSTDLSDQFTLNKMKMDSLQCPTSINQAMKPQVVYESRRMLSLLSLLRHGLEPNGILGHCREMRKDYRERVHLCCGLVQMLLTLIRFPPNYTGIHMSAYKTLCVPAPSWF